MADMLVGVTAKTIHTHVRQTCTIMEIAELKSATQFFDSKQFSDCLKILTELLANMPVTDDLVIHNELVARYFSYGATIHAPDAVLSGFVNLLEEQQKKWDDAKAIDDSSDGHSCQLYSKQFYLLTSLANYNCAVLYYHSQYYHKALDILTKFFSPHLEHLDESLSVKVVLLLFDICFRLKSLDKKNTQLSLEILERVAKSGMSPWICFIFLL
jgi:hypothetical protein